MEPVAIIGIGCRFPGAASPEAFWELLSQGKDAIREVPRDRWDIDQYYAPEPCTPGKMNTRFGGFLEQVDQFDPEFFGISPREAERMDPQQRLILEVSWEALENAAIVPESLSGSATGVFIGVGNYDYGLLMSQDLAGVNAYDGTGKTLGVTANRLSYLLNLRGPSLSLESACSSSLVALHTGVRSLQAGDSDLCIIGAVSLMLSPAQTIAYSQARMMSPEGRCKTFDAHADGYVRGEGCGVVVIKRLADAQRDGDRIQAIVRGTAVNQDGLSNGLTAPNGPSQQAVIRQAIETAGISPDQVSYVEAHGTGTPLGDPIEVRSLKTVFAKGREASNPCWIGSVKTNVGHLEAAAGMAGLLKVVLSLQHRQIPPHLHLKELNPLISLDNTPIRIPTQLEEWPIGEQARIAGLSSFGFGGTNAHIILEEAPTLPEPKSQNVDETYLLCLSGKSSPALNAQAQRYLDFLERNQLSGTDPLQDIAWTLNTRRSQFDHRLAIIAQDCTEFKQTLEDWLNPGEPSNAISSSPPKKRPPLAFLFTGQGAQFVHMGRSLYESQPIFRAAIDHCAEILADKLPVPLLSLLYPDLDAATRNDGISEEDCQSRVNQTANTQPLLFSIEYALYQLWQAWGITPKAALGHSVGEYAAACVAGVFSLADGLKLIAARGRLMQALPAGGKMLAIQASQEEIAEDLAQHPQITIAAFNGPQSLVLSGIGEVIDAIAQSLTSQEIKTKPLAVSHAFHSPLMEPMLAEFRAIANSIEYHPPQGLTLISNLTGKEVGEAIATPDYWVDHILSPVHFTQGMQSLYELGYRAFIEIGPQPILTGMARKFITDSDCLWLPSLRRGQPDERQFLISLGHLYTQRYQPNWDNFAKQLHRPPIALPTYAFQRQPYWREAATPLESAAIVAQTTAQTTAQTSAILSQLLEGKVQSLLPSLDHHLSPQGRESATEVLEAFLKVHRQKTEQDLPNWFYQIEWQSQARSHTQTLSQLKGCWILLADRQGFSEQLAQQIEQNGQSCSLAYTDTTYQRLESNRWLIHPDYPEDFERLIETVQADCDGSLLGIVHLWSLDLAPIETLSISTLEEIGQKLCSSTLHLMQAISKLDVQAAAPKIWFVTQDAVHLESADQSLLRVNQAPLWGLGQVIRQEYADNWGGFIDISNSLGNAAHVWEELNHPDGEDQIAIREQDRYVARLTALPTLKTQPLRLDTDATYLITGGLGALGLRVAQWLVDNGARHLVLVNRSPRSTSSPQLSLQLEQLRALGATVLPMQADISQQQEVLLLMERIHSTCPPLKGIIHAAGVLADGLLAHQSWQQFRRVLAPKVHGSWNLHAFSQDLSLDFFICFSSISTILGTPGQGNYAAANAFMDSLMQYRRSCGLPGLSLNWGPWDGSGMATDLDPQSQKRISEMGLKRLPPNHALSALSTALTQPQAHLSIADINWEQLGQIMTQDRAPKFLSTLIERQPQAQSPSTVHHWLEILQQVDPAQQQATLMTLLQTQVAKVLGFSNGTAIGATHNLFDLGLDSLMAMELGTVFQSNLGVNLPMSIAFDHPTLESIADHLLTRITVSTLSEPVPASEPAIPVQSAPVQSAPVPQTPPNQLAYADLTEVEAESLLLQKLEQMRY